MKNLIIGFDLSFKSTGITIVNLDDKKATNISFYRILFDKELNIKKQFSPQKIKNVNDVIYRIPKFITTDDLTIDKKDENNIEQCETTLKSMMCSKTIKDIIKDNCNIDNYENVIFCIENYIMPDFGGKNQLKTVSGLIMLQGFIREFIIKTYGNSKKIKLLTPTPSSVKSFFAKNGKADKEMMIKYFIDYYEGEKLIPEIKNIKTDQINDVIDSFAMAYYAFAKFINIGITKIEEL